MKKIMVTAAVVCLAAVAQAVSAVNWTTGTLYAPGVGGVGYAAGSEMIADGTTGLLATLFVSATVNGDATAGYTLGTPIEFTAGTTGSTVSGAMIGNSTNAALTDDTTYYAQLVITYGNSELRSQIVAMETSGMSYSADPWFGDGGMGTITALDGMELDETYGAFSAAGWTNVAPEPTSGLLLLVGMAGLALRRRRI